MPSATAADTVASATRSSSCIKALDATASVTTGAVDTADAALTLIDSKQVPARSRRQPKRKTQSSQRVSPAKRSKRSAKTIPVQQTPTTAATVFSLLSADLLDQFTEFLDIGDLLLFSSTSKSIRESLGDAFWAEVLKEDCGLAPSRIRAKGTRAQVVKFATSKACRNCKRVDPANGQIRKYTEFRGQVVCAECQKLPTFQEIGYMEALRKYKLQHFQLQQLPYRTIQVITQFDCSEPERKPKKMLNLQAVLDLVEAQKMAPVPADNNPAGQAPREHQCHGCSQVDPSFTPVRLRGTKTRSWLCPKCIQLHPIQEVGYMQAMKDFSLKRAQLLQLPCRTITVKFQDREVPKKLYNLQLVLDLVESLEATRKK